MKFAVLDTHIEMSGLMLSNDKKHEEDIRFYQLDYYESNVVET